MSGEKNKPVIGITMGDPASIGPEITLKALSDRIVYEVCRPLVIGDAACMEKARDFIPGMDIRIRPVSEVSEARFEWGTIDVLDMKNADMDRIEIGKISGEAGEAAFQYVDKVIALAMDGQIDATVTNAFSKEAVNLAGHHYSGHTEIYADKTGTKKIHHDAGLPKCQGRPCVHPLFPAPGL